MVSCCLNGVIFASFCIVQPAVAAPGPPLSQLCHVLPVEATSIYIWIPQNSMCKPAHIDYITNFGENTPDPTSCCVISVLQLSPGRSDGSVPKFMPSKNIQKNVFYIDMKSANCGNKVWELLANQNPCQQLSTPVY